MPQQLTFELATPEPPSLANFVPGRNAEVVAALGRIARGEALEAVVLVWGAEGTGKSHLLRATVAAAAAAGRPARYCGSASDAPETPADARALIAIDDVERADPAAQGRLFTLFNALRASEGQMVCSAAVPPARLPVREDVRTRLGWGLVYEVLPLTDAEKVAALDALARERGVSLPSEVTAYLLAHGRRDMASLVAALSALDRHSLAGKRPITLPLLREWLQRAAGGS